MGASHRGAAGRRATSSPGATLTETDQRAAIATLRQRAAEGVISDQRLAALTTEVWRSNTQHEMHHRTDGLVGDPARGDRRAWWRAALVWTAVLLALVLVGWLTVMAIKDGQLTAG